MNRTRFRLFAKHRVNAKRLPKQYRYIGEGVPDWLRRARMLTGHHGITGAKLTDTELNKKIMKSNQASVNRVSNPPRDYREVDAENSQKMLDLVDMELLKNEKV